jgi:hypothetical protein
MMLPTNRIPIYTAAMTPSSIGECQDVKGKTNHIIEEQMIHSLVVSRSGIIMPVYFIARTLRTTYMTKLPF